MTFRFLNMTDGNTIAINPEQVRYVVGLESSDDPKAKTEVAFAGMETCIHVVEEPLKVINILQAEAKKS